MNETAPNHSQRLTALVPVLSVDSYRQAFAFYVEYLGFNLDWEWRERPSEPTICAVSRDDTSMMINEVRDAPIATSWLTFQVANLQAFADEWNASRPGSVSIVIGPPYDIPTISLKDPAGNHLDFNQPIGADEVGAREAKKPQMRKLIQEHLDEHGTLPDGTAVAQAVGVPYGVVVEVLAEYDDCR